MKLHVLQLTLALILLHASGLVSAQDEPGITNPDTRTAIEKLRLGRLHGAIKELDISESLKAKLSDVQDQGLLQAALRDKSRFSDKNFASAVNARLSLLEVSRRLSDDEELAGFLASRGVPTALVYAEALHATDPVSSLNLLAKILGRSPSGKLILSRGDVMMTKAEPLADDKLSPGQRLAGMPTEPVWRSGLKFASLIAIKRGGSMQAYCSGTVVGKRWVVTAAHCLFDPQNPQTRIAATSLAVYLPFQNGKETVYSINGSSNHSMRKVRVSATAWIGDDSHTDFPTSSEDMQKLIRNGKDLSLLTLDELDLASLSASIEDVRIYSGPPPDGKMSAIGYGLTDKPNTGDLTLLVGVRSDPLAGLDRGDAALVYGPNEDVPQGGVCGGDSGGGLFVGRMNGTIAHPQLIGVVSALASSESPTTGVCMANQQIFTSLVVKTNYDFVCKRAPAACLS